MPEDESQQPLPLANIVNVSLEKELATSYLGYAMSTIIARALPDVRDGMKPVQRRILFAMREQGVGPNSAHVKCSAVVGETMKRFHPHGDSAIYMTLARMAQEFSLRYPLISGQGNFGSIDGDSPAAMRYTECRLSQVAMEMMEDIDKETVDWEDNYDQSTKEPTILTGKFPNFLCNGGQGIAVGMATNLAPHNLREIVDALNLLIDHPESTIPELMQVVTGPDFPTYGLILGTKGIQGAYEKGRGQVIMQAKTQFEPMDNGKHCIVITELPYQVNKARLIEQIADLVKQKRVDGITGLDDFTDRTGMRVVIELRRDANPHKILNFLLKHTPMRSTFGLIMLALDANTPRVMNLKQVLNHYLLHRHQVITRRTVYEVFRAQQRAHVLEGLQIVVRELDEIIKIIRHSNNSETARREIMKRFDLTQIQAEAILSMQLRQLTGLEQTRLEDEYKDLLRNIAHLEDILVDDARIWDIIKGELKEMRDKYGDDRRTRIIATEASDIGEEDMIPEEDMLITITRDGYIKRLPMDSFKIQHRGGKGVIAANKKEEDSLEHIFQISTHHYILFFTNRGRVYRLKAYEVPQSSRQAKGMPIINLIRIESDDVLTAVVSVKDFRDDRFLMMATQKGEVKRTSLSNLANLRANGLFCFNVEEGDELGWVTCTDGDEELVLITAEGMSLRFKETDVRASGRQSGGVRGIRLEENDQLVAMVKLQEDRDLLVISENGFGKRTPLNSYRQQTRGGKGIITMNVTSKTGTVVGARAVVPDEQVILVTAGGKAIRCSVGDIRQSGRNASGVRIMRIGEGERVSAVARINNAIDEESPEAGAAPAAKKAKPAKADDDTELMDDVEIIDEELLDDEELDDTDENTEDDE
ncbi:MAG: DNA gyrase subunit A [Armatimonadota bacterium]